MVLTLAQRGFSPGFSGFLRFSPLLNLQFLFNHAWFTKNHVVDVLLLNCYLFIYFLLMVRVRISSISKTSLLKKYDTFLTMKRDCLPMTIHCFVVFLKLVINSS